MKSILFILFTAIICSLFQSCKKGDQDPFLSLQSRKARLAGDWEEKNSSIGVVRPDTVFYAPDQYIITYYTNKEQSFKINKDGTWDRTTTYDYQLKRKIISGDRFESESEGFEKTSGTWSFLGKVKGAYKNKERVLFSVNNRRSELLNTSFTTIPADNSHPTVTTTPNSKTTSEETYNNGLRDIIYDIEMLKPKEMIWNYVSGQSTYEVTNDAEGIELNFYEFNTLLETTLEWKAN